ncbi:AGAP006790-PA-like protein [Anopheles sinensis]|uniref:AGAP006790-PA-like protein n=1 Tax=Anopheles sinensis TaxID=74873 RepID=A0A084WMY3_ANOSI|nr:AGAP006790-PA-like protein [Anopheles sinensis]
MVALVGQTLKQNREKKTNLPLGIAPTAEQLSYGEDQIYSSCLEVPSKVTGKYLIRLSDDAEPVNLLCDMQSVDVGWIVIQHRFNGSELFYRGWNDYRDGFGSLDGEFWLGLERISTILNNGGQWEIMFWMMNFQRQIRFSKFNNISLGNATDGYTLKQVGKYSGNGGDSISPHNGMKFTTFDRDNDPARYNCAKKHRGGWWYHKTCVTSNLNGEYKNAINDLANSWLTMGSAGLMQSKIMIRQVN